MEAVLDIETMNTTPHTDKKQVTLGYLFFTFFKIGMVSFGGHMALISVVQRIMVDKDKVIDNEQVLNSIGVASLLPGPLAVNVVGQIGYRLRQGRGAMISTVGIILPAFLLMCAIAWAYFSHRQFISSNGILTYVTGVVCAIILATGFQLFKKEVAGNNNKIMLFIAALALLLYTGNYFITVGLLLAGGTAGALLQLQQKDASAQAALSGKTEIGIINKIVLLILAINQVLFFSNGTRYISTGYLKLVLIFSGISLSLFGGGYVMIPIMESLFVNDLHWLTKQEFVDAIAFSQATPGPILISATFIGYKIAGFVGATLATIAIFGPSVFVSILAISIIEKHQANKTVKNVLAGIKTVVVALIISSAWRLIAGQKIDVLFVAIVAVCFILNYKYKISPVYLILGAILTGTITTNLL